MKNSTTGNGMLSSTTTDLVAKRTGPSFVLAILFWTMVIAALAGWHYYQSYRAALANVRTAALHSYYKDLAFRHWAAKHGGVYVPATAEDPPSPYLAHIPERDILSPSGRLLTLRNPAHMTRLIHETGYATIGAFEHITSLKPIRPENVPDDWEKQALQTFEQGGMEYSSLARIGSEFYLRLMRPLTVETECLKCHGPQGYQLGDIRGGISISIPWAPYQEELLGTVPFFVLGYGGLWLFGLAGILMSRHRLRRHLVSLGLAEEGLRMAKFCVDHASIGILRIDEDSHIVEVNDQACRSLGYSREELLTLSIPDIDPGFSLESWLQHRKVIRDKGSGTIETTCRCKDGSMFPIEATINYFDNADRPFSYTFFQDISERKQAEEKLNFQARLLDMIAQAVIATDRNGLITYWNLAAEKIYGWSAAEVLGRNVLDVTPTNASRDQAEEIMQASALGKSWSGDFEVQRRDGTIILVHVTNAPIQDDAGRLVGIVGISFDITDHRRAEEELRKLSHAVNQSPASVMITDLKGDIEYVNPKFTQITGYALNEVQGRHSRFLASGEKSPEVDRKLWATLGAGQEWHGEFHSRRKDGSTFWEWASISPVRNAAGITTHYVAVKEDITERKGYEEQLEYQATHDSLTGLANRALLQDRLEQSLHYAHRSGRIVAVLLLDLDRFKVINDSLGHAVGDKLLCDVAQRLQMVVREGDTVARLGGDEFVILLAEVAEMEDVRLVAAKILSVLAEPHRMADREITLTASLGVSLYPKDSDDGATLIRNADMAMYRAKNDMNSTFAFYSPEMNQRMLEALELEGALRQALERDEFCLHYQPKVDLTSGRMIGCEALVRWCNPQRGMISPDDFIPLAEEIGLIVPLGGWVLQEACRQAKAWQTAGLPPLTVAVNLSALQFRKGDLPKIVKDVLADTGLEARWLDLELTESMVMKDSAGAQRTMRALKDLGVTLSLDDFGTGYSSLNYLRRFPVDSLKIDRCFIHDVVTDPSGASVVNSVIDIAHNLGLAAVAEGVETQEQLDFLIECGCDLFQGYLFSKPLPSGEFAELFREGRRLTG